MAVEEARHDEPRVHRPLPSVGIPLLREERRAMRTRQAFVVAVLGVLGVAASAVAVVTAYTRPQRSEPTTSAAPAEPSEVAAAEDGGNAQVEAEPEPESPPPPPAVLGAPSTAIALTQTIGGDQRTTRTFGPSRGFRDAVVRAGASREEAPAIELAMTGVLDFRRCRPEDQLIFERTPGGELRAFEYRNGPLDYYRAERARDGSFRGRRVEVPVQRVRLVRAGVVRSSLGDALDSEHLGRTLVGAFVEAFEGRINFTSHTRSGDTYRIVVDEERIDGRFLRYATPVALEYSGQRTGTHRAFFFEPSENEGDYFDETGRALHGGWLRAPLRYERISSRFNLRRLHPILRRVVPHNGLDYAAGAGTPVWAAANGTVSFAGNRGANGNLVALSHDGGYETFYAHLLRIERGIRAGTHVHQRQPIGYVGSTGRSTGPHLHFGLKRYGRFVDPLAELNGPGRMLPGSQLPRFLRQVRALVGELDRVGRGARHPTPASEDEDEAEDAPSDEALD